MSPHNTCLSVVKGITIGLCVLILMLLSEPLAAPAADTRPSFLDPKSYEKELEFTQIAVRDLSAHSAVIVWETNHPAAGSLKFGSELERRLRDQRMLNYHRKRHQVSLENLIEGTRYGFQVYAWDRSEHRIKSQIVTFRTRGMPPPRFKRIRVKEKTRDGGVIRWVTNTSTRSTFAAGYDTPLRYTTRHDSPSRGHRVNLDHFHPDRRVLYQITIQDTRGRGTTSQLRSFRTRENNIAYRKPITGTFNMPPDKFDNPDFFRPREGYNRRVNDGSMLYFKGTATSGNPSDTAQWFKIDLERAHVPDTAVLYWRDLAYPKQYHIEASLRGTDWTRLASDVNAETGENIPTDGGIDAYRNVLALEANGRPYRYIRVYIPQGAPYYGKFPSYRFVQLIEFKLFPNSQVRIPTPNRP